MQYLVYTLVGLVVLEIVVDSLVYAFVPSIRCIVNARVRGAFGR